MTTGRGVIRALRGAQPVCALPYRVFRALISPDGSLLAGVCSGPAPTASEIVVMSTNAREELYRIDGPSYDMAISPCGRWIGGFADGVLAVWEIRTGREVARKVTTEHGLWRAFVRGAFDGSLERLAPANDRELDHVHPCGEHFELVRNAAGLVLFERERGERPRRAISRRHGSGRRIAIVGDEGRFVLSARGRTLRVLDLARDEVHRTIDTFLFDANDDVDVHASRDGRYVVLAAIDACALFELDWELDEDGDPAPLTRAWAACERPPIVDDLLSTTNERREIRQSYAFELARQHPDLEVLIALDLVPSEGAEWTRRALRAPHLAANAEVWAQLARLSLDAGDSAAAADAAAEGLGRSPEHPQLLAYLERARAHGRVPELVPQRSWIADADGVRAIALHEGLLFVLGAARVGVWDLASERLVHAIDVVGGVRLAVDEKWIAVALASGDIAVFDRQRLAHVARLETAPWMSPADGQQLAFAIAYGGYFDESMVPKVPVNDVAIDRAHRVLSVGDDQLLRWWDVARGVAVAQCSLPTAGRRVTANAVVLTYEALARYAPDREREVLSTDARAFVIDDSELVVGTDDGVVRWSDGTERDGHLRCVIAMAARGDLLATLDAGGAVRRWHGREARAAATHIRATDLALHGDSIITCGLDGRIALW